MFQPIEDNDPGLTCSEGPQSTRWKSSLLWYFVTDLGLELNGQITLPKVLYRTARHLPDKTAILEKKSGVYRETTFGELLHSTERFASALIELQMKTGDRVALLLKNSLEWVVTDFGTMDAGGITVPLYFTLASPAIVQLLKDSGAKILMVEDPPQLEKFLPFWEQCPDLKWIILKDPQQTAYSDGRILSFQEVMRVGEEKWKIHEEEITQRRETATYHDVATLVYTSGTTGIPKGVMLTHRNLLSNVLGLLCVSEMNEADRALSILPLSHTFERTVGYYLPLLAGGTLAYAESFEKLLQNFQEVEPTICAAVPRMFEKIYDRIQRKIAESGWLKRNIFHWALRVGKEVSDYKEALLALKHPDRRLRHRPEDRNNHIEPKIQKFSLRWKWHLARFLVYRNFKKLLGGRLKYFVSGGAPLHGEICQFFRNLDIYIYEGYGLTETSPVIAFNYRNKWHPGTVGKLLPWVQIKIDPDGEICVKGPNVMKGYFNKPEATAEVFDREGWFHTGDVGYLDKNNYLHITDRKKELIVMSNGKKVAPLAIESLLALSPFVGQSLVIGDGRKYIAALIVPNFQEMKAWAKEKGLENFKFEALIEDARVKEFFEGIVHEVNQKLSPYEQVKRFQLLPQEFSQEAGEVTPTLKVKRKVVEEKYRDHIEGLYSNFHPTEEQRKFG